MINLCSKDSLCVSLLTMCKLSFPIRNLQHYSAVSNMNCKNDNNHAKLIEHSATLVASFCSPSTVGTNNNKSSVLLVCLLGFR